MIDTSAKDLLKEVQRTLSDGHALIGPTGDHVPASTPFEQLSREEIDSLFRAPRLKHVVYFDVDSLCVQSWLDGVCWTVLARRLGTRWTIAGAQGCS